MDVDFQRDSDEKSDVDVGPELSEQEESAASLPTLIPDLVVPAIQKLSHLVANFPNIPEEQQKAWAKSASRVLESTLPTHRFALIGKTGTVLIWLFLHSAHSKFEARANRRWLIVYSMPPFFHPQPRFVVLIFLMHDDTDYIQGVRYCRSVCCVFTRKCH